MSVCVYNVSVLSCVQIAPCVGLIPRPRNPETEKVAKFQQKDCRNIDGLMSFICNIILFWFSFKNIFAYL
jgi:hypothetical protein